MGNSNDQDMLSKITSTWSNVIITFDNKKIKIYNSNDYYTDNGKVITYLGNTNQINLPMTLLIWLINFIVLQTQVVAVIVNLPLIHFMLLMTTLLISILYQITGLIMQTPSIQV